MKTYGFLFFYDDSGEDGEQKTYKAKTLKGACKKFHKWRSTTKNKRNFSHVDYEVDHEGKHLDISEIDFMQQYLS